MLSIKDSLPDFLVGTDAYKFAKVIDGVNQFKQTEIANTLRIYNPLLATSPLWLTKRLTDYGFFIPTDYPWQPLQALLMNVHSVTRLKGTELGLKNLLQLLTLGTVTIDLSNFVADATAIYPDNLYGFGVITGDDYLHVQNYLVDKIDTFQPPTELKITINSDYFANKVVKDYIEKLIPEWLVIAPNNKITITWEISAV